MKERQFVTHNTAWQDATLLNLERTFMGNGVWGEALQSGARVHLCVFTPPYLDYILDGKKTVESRFSVVRCAPYGQVDVDDLLLLKQSSGPIVGACLVDRVWSYELDPSTFDEIRKAFSQSLCADDPKFWNMRKRAQYATLMRVSHATKVKPIPCDKRDRRGWVVLNPGSNQQALSL